MYEPPAPAPDAASAQWLQARITASDPNFVTGTVGLGFEAYARIFHPLDDEPGAPRWRDVAAANGRVLHPSAAWEHISTPVGAPIPSWPTGRAHPGEPFDGELAPVALGPLCEVLARHGAAERCTFAVWDGWGWWTPEHATLVITFGDGPDTAPIVATPPGRQLDPTAPRMELPLARTYLLYRGEVRDALRFGYWSGETHFQPQSPSLFWPADHAWCVATEIDSDSTLVGGSQELVDDVVASPLLEALAIGADAPYADIVNT